MHYLLVSLAILGFSSAVHAGNWYVDKNATGTNNGTSWANAWTDTTGIAWSSVTPGDTIWISGGPSGLSYGGLTFGKSGSGANYITVRCSQEPGRNGLVSITGGINGYGNTNLVINGARNDNFAVPASVTDLWQITNNIGIRVQSPGVNLYFTRFENSKILWVEAAYAGSFDANESHGMWANCYDTAVDRSEVGYCYIHDSSKDGINVGGRGNDNNPWNTIEVHHSIIWRNVDDGIQMGASGLTAHHNIIGVKSLEGTSGHPDTIQMSGGQYLHIYNNILYNSWNAWLYNEINVPVEWAAVGNLLFYGNICYNERDWIGTGSMNYGFFAQTWRDPGGGVNPIGPVNDSVLTNVYLCNNVFYNQRSGTVLLSHSLQQVPHVEVWRTVVTNFVFENNIILDCGYASEQSVPFVLKGTFPSSIVDPTNPLAGTLGMFYTKNEAMVDYNVVAGAGTRMAYAGVIYAKGEDMAAIGFSHNYSAIPKMVSTNTYNFRLLDTDTVARNKGVNLSGLAPRLPGILTDLYGNVRGADGAWDIGAHEYNSTTQPGADLLVKLDFDGPFNQGIVSDQSGNTNNGLRFGRCEQTTNWPVVVMVTNGSSVSTGAAFDYYWDNYGQYARSGDYIAITNLIGGTEAVDELTVMLWAKYDAAHDRSGSPAAWTTDHNASLVDNGRYLTAGSWRLGRENFWSGAVYNNKTKWTVFNGATASQRLQITFNDAADANGATAQMNHYAAVFNRGTNTLYLNGVMVTNAVYTQTNLQLNARTHWIGIGAWPHHGSTSRDPWLTNSLCSPPKDEYPNTFWFHGKMDDVRIYGRALTASEVSAVCNGGTAPAPSAPRNLRTVGF